MAKVEITKIVGAGMMLIAGIATVAGVYQLTRKGQNQSPPSPLVEARTPTRSDVRDRRPRKIEQESSIEHPFARAKNKRCVGGVVFAEVDGELRNIGYCP